MGWLGWFSSNDDNEQTNEKVTEKEDGSTKYESMRTIDGDKNNHQHVWMDFDKDGNLTGGGATPDRGDRGN